MYSKLFFFFVKINFASVYDYFLPWGSLDCKIPVNHIKQSPSHNNRAVFQQCWMTLAGDVSYSQKKHAMLPVFHSFRALAIPMIEDYSCCHLQEISGNNVVILFHQNVQYCYPRNWLNGARTLLNIQQLALLGSNKTSFFNFTKYFWYLLLTNNNYCYPELLEWFFFWACICISRSIEI